ncbi:MAG TPA: hypothetical protein VND95_07920, partial [Stellaceae bacterium]|nr:hypothetical protein [Stellaceae bacterium]
MATSYSWNSGSNDWFASGVWTPSGTPGAGDTATLGLSTTYTVTIAGTESAAATAVAINDPNATLAITGTGSLAVSNYLVNRGTLDLDSTAGDGGGSLTVAGVLDNAKIVQIGNSTASATTTASFGSLVNFSGATFSLVGSSAGPTTVTVGAVTNAGTIDVGANSTLALTSGKVFTQSAASGVTTIEGALTATTLTESAGSITVNGTLTATTLTESGGSLTVGSGGTLSATTLNLNGGTFAAPSLTVGTGQALVVGKTAVVTLSTGPLAVTSGIATITGTVDNTASLATTAVSVTAGGSLKLDNGFSFSGENVTGATGTYTAGTAGSLLELAAAGGHGTLSTLGGSTSSDAFQGFSELLVDAGASWTVNWDAATAAGERLIGSNGTNILTVAAQGTVDLSNVSGFPTIDLASGSGTYTVTVGTLTLSGTPVTIDDSNSSGTATITSTDTTAGKTLTVKTGSGTNAFSGNKENDIVDAQTVTSSDTLTGGTGTNTLYLTTAAGTYDLTGVSNFRYIHMASGGDAVTLADGTFLTGSTVIYGAASGADSITASGTTLSTGKTLVYYGTTGSTGISLAGGTENDYIRASAAAVSGLTLTGNTLSGGGGTNTLVMTTAGTVHLDSVSNFGLIYLAGTGNTVTLSDTTLSGAVTLYGSTAKNNTVTSGATGSAPGNLLYVASTGLDSFTGGSENDTVRVTAAALAGGDTLGGGTGTDLLILNSAGSVDLSRVSNFGTINLAGGTNTVTVTDTTLTGAVTINGLSSKNTINASGTSSPVGALTYLGRINGDSFTGGVETDLVSVTAAAVINDTLHGSSSSANVLTLTTAGAVNLSNVTGFPTIDLANGNNAVTTTVTQISGKTLTGYSATNVNTLTLTNTTGASVVDLTNISNIGTINLAANNTTGSVSYKVGDPTLSGGSVTINDNAGGSLGNTVNAGFGLTTALSKGATLTYNATHSSDAFYGGTEQDVVKVSA